MSLIVFKCLTSVEPSITLSARDVIPTQNALNACSRGSDAHIPDQPKCHHQSTSMI